MALLGLLAPFLPDLLGVLRGHLDHKYELEMMRLRHDQARDEASWRLQEVEVRAQVQEMLAARKPHESYGVKLLEAANRSDSKVWGWSFNTLFALFGLLDLFIASVRPTITYWAFGLYVAVKAATLYATFAMMAQHVTVVEAMVNTLMDGRAWTSFDADMLQLIVGFWFGNRIRNGGRSGAKH